MTYQPEPILTVCLITYNHVKYIRQAIEGVLMQECTYDWHLVIADDFSTDGTRDIVIEYYEKYPELISLILQKTNVGAEKNWEALIKYPKTKYIAYFEGDDYWIDRYKLQKQISYLESHENCGLVYSQSKIEINGNVTNKIFGEFTNKSSLFAKNTIPTLTVMFRGIFIDQYFNEIYDEVKLWKIGDYPLWIWISQCSDIYFLNEITSVYRVLDTSISNASGRIVFNLNSYEISRYLSLKFNEKNRLQILLRKGFYVLASVLKNDPKRFFSVFIYLAFRKYESKSN